MPRLDKILLKLFGEENLIKAKRQGNFFESWPKIVKAVDTNSDCAAHSAIKDLSKGVLLITVDHVGWRQILQTQKELILEEIKQNYSDVKVKDIDFVVG